MKVCINKIIPLNLFQNKPSEEEEDEEGEVRKQDNNKVSSKFVISETG